MSKLIVIAVGAAGIAMAFVGQGVAHADALSDVTGKYYGQAKDVLAKAGFTPKVATRVGDLTNDDKCVIDRIQPANFTSGDGTAASSKTVYVYLNCYANVASANQPGYSRQSQLGAAAYNAQQQAQQQQQAAPEQQAPPEQSQAEQQAAAAQQAQSEQSVTGMNPH